MSDLTIPDSPAEFFTEVVPERFAALVDGAASAPGAICFDVIGAGMWSLSVADGQIAVAEGRHDETLVHVSLDETEWRDAVERMMGGGLGPFSAAAGGGIAAVMSNPQAAGTLKAAQGTLKVIVDDDGASHWVAVTFGGAEPNLDVPRATLSMTREVAEQMGVGNANPQELFMAGKIQITGDLMMLMQLAPILA